MASPAAGQTIGDATGTIEGTVTDSTGGVLTGVEIRVTSSALMQPQRAVAGPDGDYRIVRLPPGDYVLEFARDDFAPARRSVRVESGSTKTVPVVLHVAAAARVTVEGDARALDPHATTLATSWSARQLETVPGTRGHTVILAATPAVHQQPDVGGSVVFGSRGFSAYGTTGFNRPTLDGIAMSRQNQFFFNLDYGSFDEVWVGRGAFGPEWSTPGVHIQAVTKSGGNQYHGSLYAGYQHGSWQAVNVDDGQIARGAARGGLVSPADANRLHRYHDLNADIGGFIRRERAWLYVSGRDQASASNQVSYPSGLVEARSVSLTGKVTMRAGAGQRLVAFAIGDTTRQPVQLAGFLRNVPINTFEASTTSQQTGGVVWKAEWNGAVPRDLYVEARAGQFEVYRADSPKSSAPRVEDALALEVRGGNRGWREDLQRDQISGSLSYLGRGRLRRHHLKAGGEITRIVTAESWTRAYPGDVLHVLRGGVPDEVYLFQTPSRSESGLWWYSAYASDSWHDRRLTLNLGARYDRFRLFLPEQHHPAGRFNATTRSFPAVDTLIDWNVAAPRAGASYQLTADGRTFAKSSYGLYWLPPGGDLGLNANPNARTWWKRFAWTDTNGSSLWEPDDATLLLERRGGTALELLDPGLKLSYVHEITAQIERELARPFHVRTGLVWRSERRPGVGQPASRGLEAYTLPVPIRDPGPDGIAGSSDDGAEMVLYDRVPDPEYEAGLAIRNVPGADSDALTWELAASRDSSRGWSMAAAYAHTWYRDHAAAYLGQRVRANAFPLTPNDFIHTDARGRHVFDVWVAKVYGTYSGPWGLLVTPFVRHQSGQPFARTFLADLPYEDVRVLAEPVGARRQDHLTLFDLGVQRDVRLGGGRRVAGFVEVFNVFNANAEQTVSWSSGRSFLRPLGIVAPRIVRLGLKVDW